MVAEGGIMEAGSTWKAVFQACGDQLRRQWEGILPDQTMRLPKPAIRSLRLYVKSVPARWRSTEICRSRSPELRLLKRPLNAVRRIRELAKWLRRSASMRFHTQRNHERS